MEAGSGAAAVVGSTALGLFTATGSHDISDRGLRPGRNLEVDDIVPELARSIHPRERPDWEETISAMARSAEIPELSSEPLIRSCSSTASMKVKNVKKLPFTKGHFPKLAECAHFHYENVDFGSIQAAYAEILLMNSKTRFYPKSQLKSSERKAFLVTMQSRIRIEFPLLRKKQTVCTLWSLLSISHINGQWTWGGLLSLALPLRTMKDLCCRSYWSRHWKRAAWYLALHRNHNESKTKALLRFSYSQA
ncbi:rho GTPase-activating protein 32 isoform X1 [Tachysurus ichikawai]